MAAIPEATSASSWFSPLDPSALRARSSVEHYAFRRMWQGFMTARATIALGLLLLHGAVFLLSASVPLWLVGLCGAYLGATLTTRLLSKPPLPGRAFDTQALPTLAIDILVYSVLQYLQAGGINYAPLFGLPVLMGAVLGSRMLGLSTAAGVSLLLLADAARLSLMTPGDHGARLVQAALTSAALFALALLTHQLASRLAREERSSRRNQVAARVQTLVNELVIENLTDGVLVIDVRNVVRAANPSARHLVGGERPSPHAPFGLDQNAAWKPLADLAHMTFVHEAPQVADIALQHPGQPRCHLQARTQLTPPLAGGAPSLCVMFLQDLRETEARLRTEKLAAMGRMSAAVAHEIRNPLAAISQANALLAEELPQPAQQRLTTMISQNAQRLSHIVDDVLDIARVRHLQTPQVAERLRLDETVQSICRDWDQQTRCGPRLALDLQAGSASVHFAPEHLRRVLVNLLDNALRYASPAAGAIQVVTRRSGGGQSSLRIWSDGAPLELTVQRHLFEPFFSSESRSSGLGLFICRELCERHGAAIGYERRQRLRGGDAVDGNDFFAAD